MVGAWGRDHVPLPITHTPHCLPIHHLSPMTMHTALPITTLGTTIDLACDCACGGYGFALYQSFTQCNISVAYRSFGVAGIF